MLEPFYQTTKLLEGHYGNGALYEIFTIMDTLLEHLEIAKGLHNNLSQHLAKSIILEWEKLNKYYSLTDTNPVLYAAVGLYPPLKYENFKYAWKDHLN